MSDAISDSGTPVLSVLWYSPGTPAGPKSGWQAPDPARRMGPREGRSETSQGRPPMGEWAIRVKDLRKQYKGRDGVGAAVNGLDLEGPVGDSRGLLGPSGAGKTTTIEILEGVNRPTSGKVE